jgi:hypothetical protein
MLLLRAPYGEEKLFALIAPPAGRQRMEDWQVQMHKTAPAFPHKAQATRNAGGEPAARKSNDYPQDAPMLGKHTQHYISRDPEKQ